MDKKAKKVAVVACSGIGKSLGALSREITYELIERVKPGIAVTKCLGLVVSGDSDALKMLKENPVITIDGCAKECSKKSVVAQGSKVDRSFQIMDFMKRHKGLKPDGISELNDAGQKLASLAADDLAEVVDDLINQEGK
jgi:uncharacterized metal-binding protein